MTGLTFTAIDFEHCNSSLASLCSVGLAHINDGVLTGTEMVHVRPPVGFDGFTTWHREHMGINMRAVALGQQASEYLPGLVAALANTIIVGHGMTSAEFPMLAQTWTAAGCQGPLPQMRFVDTLVLARSRLPHLSKHRLDVVHEYLFGQPLSGHHDPSVDATASAQIALKLLNDHDDLMANIRVKNAIWGATPKRPNMDYFIHLDWA